MDEPTVEPDDYDSEDIEKHDSERLDENLHLPRFYQKNVAHLQKTNFTTLGMFREGFFVSPAVIPRDSVPPSEIALK